MTGRLSVACLLLAAGACAATPEPVPVVAGDGDLRLLEGIWRGHYSSAASGRSGSIRFALGPGERTAEGEVLMVPGRADTEPRSAADPAPQAPETLPIRFVRIDRGRLTGTVGPYRDPGCGCMVATTFTGHRAGDRFEGEYVTRGGKGHLPVRGTWSALRQPE